MQSVAVIASEPGGSTSSSARPASSGAGPSPLRPGRLHYFTFCLERIDTGPYKVRRAAVLPCCRAAVLPCCRAAVLPCCRAAMLPCCRASAEQAPGAGPAGPGLAGRAGVGLQYC